MKGQNEYSLTKGLEICENCEWAINKVNSRFLNCLLSGEDKGLVQGCKKFRLKTGNHISM